MPPPTTTRSKRVPLQRGERVCARDHGRNVTKSPGGSALGRLLVLPRRAQVEQAEHPLAVGHADRRAALRACAARRACASSRRARGRARRAGRCRSRPRPRSRSSSSWIGSPALHRPTTTTSVGARSSFAAASAPAASFSARQRLRAEHAEAPRVGEVVVRRPAGQLEQLLERLARHRLGARRPCACAACGSRPRPPPGRS